MTSKEYNNYDNCCYNTDISSSIKKFAQEKPILTTGLALGSALAVGSIISPTVRKVTVPTCKFITKQQLKIFAGIGLLSLATFISSPNEFMDDETNYDDDDIIFLD